MALPITGYAALAERALTLEAWRANRGRLLLSVVGVALGVALGVAVHLINNSALNQFTQAAHLLSGDADLAVRGGARGFAEDVYPRIAALPEVDVASPVVEADLRIPGHAPLRLVGIDAFEALRIQPQLLAGRLDRVRDLLANDAIILSQPAAEELDLARAGEIAAQVGTRTVPLQVVGVLPAETNPQRVAFADIATAQWRLDRLGLLSRIDVRLIPDADPTAAAARIAALLPDGVEVGAIDAESQQAEMLTRAYRVNLNMLALVALFTGAFLVFATQALTILQRRTEIAILRVLGVTRGGILRILLTESMVVGAVGAALGLAGGYALAAFALARFGGDLGAGYFGGTGVSLQHEPFTVVAFFALGVLAALAGCIVPAWNAATRPPAPALKGAQVDDAAGVRARWPGFLLLAATVLLMALPPIHDLPLGGYAAVAALLAGALWLAPAFAETIFRRLPPADSAVVQIAVEQLRGGHSQLAISIAAIVVSFSLMVAMLIMIGSFRGSLEQWLGQVLPADAYVRAGGAGQTGYVDEATFGAIAALPSVARSAGVRVQEIRIERGRIPLTLLARDLDAATASATLPLAPGTRAVATGDAPAVWISEAAADLYGWHPGTAIELPLGAAATRFVVAGVWRDYTRQNGTLLVDRATYRRLTGDARVNDVWIWLKDGRTAADLARDVEQLLGRQGLLDVRDVATIRRGSLALFDRTFAVTYVLEAVAVLIGLFGISVGFSSQVLARRAEFGVLRHLGVTRGQIIQLLGLEGLLAGAIGTLYGLITGAAISVVLIRVINRQSFHWSMDLHLPLVPLLAISAVLALTATVTAMWSGRGAMSTQPINAVKEDW
jgi:putative ABC transport system permease protein